MKNSDFKINYQDHPKALVFTQHQIPIKFDICLIKCIFYYFLCCIQIPNKLLFQLFYLLIKIQIKSSLRSSNLLQHKLKSKKYISSNTKNRKQANQQRIIFKFKIIIKIELKSMYIDRECRQPTFQKSKLDLILQQKAQYIRNVLIKIGCPLIAIHSSKQQDLTMRGLQLFFQPTDSRLQLIQWFIAIISPGYKLNSEYRNCYDDDPYISKIKKYSVILWEVGVMPVSKFTKNLDYFKYVQGLLGLESAVNLIFDLAELSQAKFSSNIKNIQQVASDLLGDLIKHNGQLVNIDYDPYGVTFPAKYSQNGGQDDPSLDEKYQSMNEELKQMKINQISQQQQLNNDYGKLFEQLQSCKQVYSRRYSKLQTEIERMIKKYQNLIPNIRDKEAMSQIKELHRRRMLNVSRSLSKNYRNYKNLVHKVKQQQFSNELTQLRDQLISTIKGINQITNIYQ